MGGHLQSANIFSKWNSGMKYDLAEQTQLKAEGLAALWDPLCYLSQSWFPTGFLGLSSANKLISATHLDVIIIWWLYFFFSLFFF